MEKNNQKKVFAATLAFSIVGLGLLSGCGWFSKDKKDATESSIANKGDVLLSIDGKPVLTVEEYEEQLEMARQAHQEIDMLLQMMPNAEKEYIFQGIMTGKIMKEWAAKEGIDKSPEFLKQQAQMHDAMDLNLYMKAFYDKHPLHISDSEVKEFFEAKKDAIQGLQLSQGGVHVAYVRFDSKVKADAFSAKIKEVKKLEKFQAAAQAEQLTVAEATINDKSSFSDSLKSAVLAIKHFPKHEVVKVGDNAYWVLFATGKVDAKYRDHKSPEVQQGLKKMMSDERRQKQLEEFVTKMKSELNVTEHGQYFENKENKKRAAMEAMMQQGGSADKEDEESEDDATSPVEKL